jgi:hypothetical protein
MGIYFHDTQTMNSRSGNWTALPTLPAGFEPMREVILTCASGFRVGTCTAGQSTEDSGWFVLDAGRHSLGVVNYNKITVRAQGTSSVSYFVYHLSPMDEGPEGN